MDSTETVCSQANSRSGASCRQAHSTPGDRATESASVALLEQLYGPVLTPLQEVERQLASELRSSYETLAPVLNHGTQLGGKRLRPAMLLLSGAAVGRLSPEHITLGAVIEMVHTATLVHDDVLDDASTRRHVATVNARWNGHVSILLGDYLFAQSFRLAATLSSTLACQWIGEAARAVCEGELRQLLQRGVVDLDEETYLSMIAAKTGELCRVACQLGARYADGSDSLVEAMGAFGDSVGIAFQIADDYLDLWGDDQAVGKTLGTDIVQGKMTLPLIRLLQNASQNEHREIHRIMTGPADQRLRAIRPLLERSDAQAYTMRIAEEFQQKALDSLDLLVASEARSSLSAIARFSVDRRF